MNLQDVHDNKEIVNEVGCTSCTGFRLKRVETIGLSESKEPVLTLHIYHVLYKSRLDFSGQATRGLLSAERSGNDDDRECASKGS